VEQGEAQAEDEGEGQARFTERHVLSSTGKLHAHSTQSTHSVMAPALPSRLLHCKEPRLCLMPHHLHLQPPDLQQPLANLLLPGIMPKRLSITSRVS